MKSEIAVDAPLDYVTFQILPENRYGARIVSNEKEELVGDGPLELLLEHLPDIKDQIINGSCDNFKLELPNSIEDRAWFTKATLSRFLHIIGSSDGLKKSIALTNELSQLEETRKFHVSLHTQDDKITSSDSSKNGLLQAMASRIAALTEELLSTFNATAGAAFSIQEMIDLKEFGQHFADVDLRNMLLKLPERSQECQTIIPVNNKKSPVSVMSKNDYENKISKNSQILGQPTSMKPVQYNASPAKAAELERQSSTGSDNSSFSSEDDQPSAAERSRTLIRSASPRRSASPMRKVQIGRSGSRRTPALSIKSLPHFPAREKISSYRDKGEDEEATKKTEINVTRMSVQDAISLFESKQKDDAVESQKKLGTDNSTNTTKAVLRRWSSGMSESQKSMSHDTTEHITSKNDVENEDAERIAEVKVDAVPASENPDVEDTMVLEGNKNVVLNPSEDEVSVSQTEDTDEKLDSAEWNRKKEEELNKMLMKFAEYTMSNNKNTEPDNNKNRVSRLRQNSGFNGNHKDIKGEKLSGDKSVKRVEKQPGVRAKQRVPDKPKPEKTSVKASDVGKRVPASRTPNVNKTSPVSSNTKKEVSKPAVPKKAPSTKTSPLPATRKSWPSTPSPRASGTLPTRSPTTSSSVTSLPRPKSNTPAPRQKPQSPGPVQRPTPKLEKPQLEQKAVKKQQIDTKKSLKKVDDSKTRVVPQSGKTTKAKTATAAPEENTAVAVSPAKAVVRKKVAKKSSVVPLEVKPSVRKVSEKSPAKNSSQRRETPPQAEEALSKVEDPSTITEDLVTISSDTIHPVESQELEAHDGHLELEIETEAEKPEDEGEKETSVTAPAEGDVVGKGIFPDSPANIQIQPAQESVISPAAWEESSQQDTEVPVDDSSSASALVNPDAVASAGTRVRHSLSQMLLEETSEPDIIEWGNAEHPPSMVYQKDAPKGLKRLLKFARKNKETNGTAWASPYASEGEDDGDEYRNLGKRNSDNLLKVALHSNYAEGFLSDSEPHSARSNTSNSSTRSSNKFQDGHASSKGARSFFSLSAFRSKN